MHVNHQFLRTLDQAKKSNLSHTWLISFLLADSKNVQFKKSLLKSGHPKHMIHWIPK